MYRLLLLLSISLETIHLIRGQATNFQGRFYRGGVYFEWDLDFSHGYITGERVYFRLDDKRNSMDVTSLGNCYLEVDILKYTYISIEVYTTIEHDMLVVSEEYNGFKIPKVIKAEHGKDKEIEIPLDFIPSTQEYVIKNDDTNIILFEVQIFAISSKNTSKYMYVSKRNTTPKSITIKIKNATTEDAGYISTGSFQTLNGPGVVLVVTGSPTKPTIAGNVNVPVGEYVTLTCESNSTSAPSYYKLLPPLTYFWYRNESEITRGKSNQYRLRVDKRHKHDAITCISREEINSERSKPFRLNPQYGPDSVVIRPVSQLPECIIEGGKFGPYICSADCNPPCTYQWERRVRDSNRYDQLKNGPTFNILYVRKSDSNSYRCRANSKFKNSGGTSKDIILHVCCPPFQPLNFSGISEMHGQINLTWISAFNGGSDQFFLLKQKHNSQWLQIENISDIGQGRQMSVVVEKTVEAGGTFEFMLQSCNRINCSEVINSAPIKTQDNPTSLEDTGISPFTILAVSSVPVVVLVAAVVVVVFFKYKRKSRAKSRIPKSPPKEVFAKVDESDINNATAEEMIHISVKETDATGENENTHANADEATPIMKQVKTEILANPPKTKTKFD